MSFILQVAFRPVDPRLSVYCNNQKLAKNYYILIFRRQIVKCNSNRRNIEIKYAYKIITYSIDF
jgi:hypothetical protein